MLYNCTALNNLEKTSKDFTATCDLYPIRDTQFIKVEQIRE